jgi:hypothetical protein
MTEAQLANQRAYYNKWSGKWQSRLRINRKLKYLGSFGDEGTAAVCYNFHIAWLGLNKPMNVITEADWIHD